RAKPLVPQVDELLIPRLQRRKAEAIAVVLDVRAIVLFDERIEARPRLPRRPLQPAGEEHVVLRLQLFELRLEPLHLYVEGLGWWRHGSSVLSRNQKPHQGQPQLARVRHRTS